MRGVITPRLEHWMAGEILHRRLLARWRQASSASFYSATWCKQCQPGLEVQGTCVEVTVSSSDLAGKEARVQSPIGEAAVPLSGRKVKAKLVALQEQEHGLTAKHIPQSAWKVLHRLNNLGYESYLVGGSVRDLLLKQVPKDFDVLSTANPKQVQKGFPSRPLIVGKRFPICLIPSGGSVIEVSSFSTTFKAFGGFRPKTSVRRPESLQGVDDWDESDFSRWENSQKRDFTVNGLMYDPFQKVVYDYVGGLQDLKKLKIRTVIRAKDSFAEDPVRMLRAVRFAARLQFSLARATEQAMEAQKHLISQITGGRLMLEVNTLMAYGAAERSVRLLWRYGILESLFPLHAQYLKGQNFARQDQNSNLLLDFLANMDKVFAPDRPCHASLWTAVLAFHLALTSERRSRISAAAVALAVYHKTSLVAGVRKAKRICERHRSKENSFVRESVSSELIVKGSEDGAECDTIVKEAKLLLVQMRDAASRMRVDSRDKVVSRAVYNKVEEIMVRAASDLKSGEDCPKKKRGDIREDADRMKAVADGDLEEVSYVFSRIVLTTLFPTTSQ